MAPNQSADKEQRRRRRRPRPAAAIALVALASAAASPSSFVAHGARRSPRPKKAAGKRRDGDRALPKAGDWADAPADGGGRDEAAAARAEPPVRGDVQLHAWPHPDSFRDERQDDRRRGDRRRRDEEVPGSMGDGDWAGKSQLYGQPVVEYFKNGLPLQPSTEKDKGSDPVKQPDINDDNDDNVRAQSEFQTPAHVANYMSPHQDATARGQTQSQAEQISYEEWKANREEEQTQAQQQPRGNAAAMPVSPMLRTSTFLAKSVAAAALPVSPLLRTSAHAANYMSPQQKGAPARGEAQSQAEQISYEEWKASREEEQAQAQQQPRGRERDDRLSESRPDPPRPSEAQPESRPPTPPEDPDVVSGKQVILRPRSNGQAVDADLRRAALPPMGGAPSSPRSIGSVDPVVYYYDPRALRSPPRDGHGHGTDAPELALPEVVYDSSGRALRLEQVHAGGRNEVFLEVRPRAVWGSDLSGWNGRWTTLQSRLRVGADAAGERASSGAPRSQDQLIVLFTVATMAVMVGALSAKRLRSRKLLESCMHPELDEDWEEDFNVSAAGGGAGTRYDKKFDVDTGRSLAGSSTASQEGSGSTGLNSGSGFGALLGGRKDTVGYYSSANEHSGTGGGGGLHWRGDMEKFDV